MRELRQKEAAESWINSKRNSILYLTPRTGKTRIALNIIKELKPKKILVTYPNLVIKKAWEAEISKVGSSKGSQIDYCTFLGLKKVVPGSYDLLIIDEIHQLSEAQIEAVKALKTGIEVLGMTGSLSKDTEDTLKYELGMDICYRYSLDQAVKEGVVADYSIKVIRVPLDDMISKKFGKAIRTEKQQFDHLTKVIGWMEMSGKPTFWLRLARMRIIQNSISKLQKTKELLDDKRSLIFCGVTSIADKLGCPVYHAKKSEQSTLEEFCKGKSVNLAVCKMLNMGITIKDLNRVILNYFSSNEENIIQQVNRAMNYEYAGKIAEIILISSDEPVELAWLKKALKSFDSNKITYA